MAGFEEDRAVMAAAHDKAKQALAPLQEAHAHVEEARGMLLGITESSAQAAAHDALALFSRSMEEIVVAQQTLAAGVQTSEGVSAHL